MIAKFFTVFSVEVGVAEQHGQSTVPHGAGKLDIRDAPWPAANVAN